MTGANPTFVTVASDTVTTNTLSPANSPNDRLYRFNDDIVATVDTGVLVGGFGLTLESTAFDGAVAMTNNGFVIIDQAVPALSLEGNGGPVTYSGTGSVLNAGNDFAMQITNGGTGTADVAIDGSVVAVQGTALVISTSGGALTFTQSAGTLISSVQTVNQETVSAFSVTGDVSLTLDGTMLAGGGLTEAVRASSGSGDVIVNFTGAVAATTGGGFVTGTAGAITYTTSGTINAFAAAFDLDSNGNDLITLNVTGGIVHAGGNGVDATANGGGGILIDMTGGQIGTVDQHAGDRGILASSTGTAGDIDITATSIFADVIGIQATITNAASTADINVTVNGVVDGFGGIGIDTRNDGTGSTTVTNNGTVSGATGIRSVFGAMSVFNSGTVTGTGGTAIEFDAGDDTLTITPTSVINGQVLGAGGADTLQLAGSGSGIFDVSDVGPVQFYREFEIFNVLSGSWSLNGSTLDPWNVLGGTLGGDATIGDVTVLAGGTLAPGASTGELHAGSATFAAGATFAVEIGGAGAGQFDQLDVSGTVALGGATLNVSLINGFAPAAGATFIIIENDGADPIGGTFAGLPQGAGVIVGGVTFSISYAGGDGNDVVLTRLGGVGVEIFGDDGDNLLTGSIANDTLHGRGGNDRLIGGLGADTLNGGAGTDTADFLSDGSVTVDLAAGTGTTGTGVDTLTSIERVIGSQFDDTLRGDGGDNVLDGAAGVDVINGFGGNDRLEGGAGNDLLFGGDGNDEVIGQSGNDWLDGANGDDLVRGGEGNDSLEGRDGNDRLEGDAGDDTIDAGAGNDLIFGGDGNDRLFAAGGTDTLTGGAGNDLFYYTNSAPGQMDGDTITDFQSVAGQNTGDSLVIRAGFSNIAFNNGSTAITYDGVTQTLFHPGVTLSLANDILVV